RGAPQGDQQQGQKQDEHGPPLSGLPSPIDVSQRVGGASQVHPLPIPLAAVVQNSPIIVVVDDAAPAFRDVQIPAGSTPMSTRLMRVRVVEVVRAPVNGVQVEQVLEVGEAHLDTMLSVHQMYYDENIAESPIYETYEGGAPNAGLRVMFLGPCTIPEPGPSLCLSAVNAIEKTENLPTVRQLIDSR
ncbi:MAG: hypothetical protein AAFV53_40680, partial [Myxococcota bacterium]